MSYPKPICNNTIGKVNYNNWLSNLENHGPDILMSDEDNDIDFEVVEQTAKSDDDNDVYVKYVSPSPNSPV